MKYIFIDTNIFLHFQDFRNIDWLKESNADKCTLVIAPIVIDELDEKKIGNTNIAKKARRILQILEGSINKPKINERIYLEIILNKPLQKVYNENQLNFNEQDHRLIASIIDFKNKMKLKEVFLCSNDIGPRIRALQFGIVPLKLSDKYFIPEQNSELEKKIKKLKQENIKLQNKVPKLDLTFENSTKYSKIHTNANKFYLKAFNTFKSKKMEEIRHKFPYINTDYYNNPLALLTLNLDNTQINSYNRELDEFYHKYENSLNELFEKEKRKNLTYEIELQITNLGTIPAEDIDIHLFFPKFIDIYMSSELNKEIDLPEPPYKPKNRFDYNFSTKIKTPIFTHKNELKNKKLKIKKTENSTVIDINIKRLKHGYTLKLENMSVVFSSYEMINNFQIEYIISADNIPKKIKDTLNIVFIKE